MMFKIPDFSSANYNHYYAAGPVSQKYLEPNSHLFPLELGV